AVAREPTRASDPRHRADRARRGDDLADHAVAGVGDEEVARPIEGYTRSVAELGRRGRAAVARKAGYPRRPRHRADLVRRRIDPANDEVVLVGDEEIPSDVEGNARGEVELGRGGRATVAREAAGAAGPCDRADRTRRHMDLADDAVTPVGDEEVARPIDGDARRVVELGRLGRAAVTRETTDAAGPRHRADRARRRSDLADHAVG